MSTHFHSLRIKSITPDTDEAVIVSFDVPSTLKCDFEFTQGQHLTLRTHLNGKEERRSYSICSGVDDGDLRIGVRQVNGGVVSGWINTQLKVGDSVDVLPPDGRFFVPIDSAKSRHYLGIAGGSGITPILAIIKTVLAREPQSSFTLIYGNRRQNSTMFKEELEDLKNHYMTRLTLHTVFSQEHMDSPLYSGRLTQEKLGDFFGTLIRAPQIDHVFICGPHGFNDEADAALLAAGVPKERIHIERFGVPDGEAGKQVKQSAKVGDAPQAKVAIIRDGLTREIEFRTEHGNVLEAAAAAGLEVPYSCKSGVCCTCRAKLIEGKVRMDRNFALEPHEVEAGFILTCQSHPLTDRVVISFDQR
jgi:ring-1,2-phenylacetyl-CoA epoxidase subunit PaaE